MPRGNRCALAGHVWHLTERCHRQQFLLKFARDRRAWVQWLYESRTRFGLSVLNYQGTSNHGHLLVRDRGDAAIARSLQLIAGCVGRASNRRTRRRGAFWWTEAVAVGRRSFVEGVREALGSRAWHRHLETVEGVAVRRDPTAAYGAHASAEMAAPSEKSSLHSQHT